MQDKDHYLKTVEFSTGQNYNMISGIPNNAPLPSLAPGPTPVIGGKPLDKVKELPAKRRSREREER